jgi:anti-anti-sigma factor
MDTRAGVPTLVIAGRMGTSGAETVRSALASAIADVQRLRLDLEQVDYMSSAGIAVLRDAARQLHSAGGVLELAAASEPVRLALRLAGDVPHLAFATSSSPQ